MESIIFPSGAIFRFSELYFALFMLYYEEQGKECFRKETTYG